MSLWQAEQRVLYTSAAQLPIFSASASVEATYHGRQPFCRDYAGWVPLNAEGFNSCFIDAVVGGLGACGIVFGAIALLVLLRSELQKPLFKTWNFYARFIIIAPLLALTAAQAIILLAQSPAEYVKDVSFWSPVVLHFSILMVGVVQYVENWRSKVPNGLVLVYWLFLSIIYLVKTLSLPPRPFHVNAPQTYVMFPIITALCIMEFSLEWLIPSLMQKKVVIGEESINPRVTADIFSEMFFNWLTPFMVHGYSNVIKEKDLYTLRDIDTADHVTPRFQRAWATEENKKTPRLWLAITKAYGMEWIVPMIYELVGRALGLAQPILLQYFILWVASRNTEDPQSYAWGSVLAALMLLSTAFKTLFQQQSAQLFIETALRVKVSLQVQLYQKSIYLSNSAKKDMNVGDIVTRMSSDGQKVWMAVRLFPWTIAAPLEFIFSMVLLYRFLGWSMLAGVVLLIAISPLNALVIVFNQKFEKEQMDAKDKRTRLITEIVENMKSIKLYAWANAYIVKLRAVRNDEELNAMRKERVLGATFNILFSLPRYLVAAATFAVYSYFVPERPLTSDIIFPALALFNILNFSLGIFPMLINFYVQGKVASGRLVEMYTSEQLQPDAVERKPRGDGPELVSVSGASFSPSSKDEKVLVEVDDFSTSAGELNCIIGQVGSGKSSLLNAILGNLHKTKGTVSVYGRVSYVPQTAWVMNATIKENIIFGRPFDGGLYNKTLKNCALLPDLASLTDGDQTEVGEKGISLSGGQKARLSLARAVYSQSDVYIMDDCLSAVDEHVSKALIENVIGPNGMLKDAARVLATNSTRVLKSANTIHYLQDGIVKEHGSYEKLMSDRGSVYDLVNTLIEQQQQNGDSSGSGSKTPLITIEETEGSSTAASSSPPQSLAAEVAEALVQVSETVTIAEGAQADKAIQLMTEADVADTTPLLSAGGTADISGKDPEAAAEEGVIDSLAKRKVEKSEEGQVSWSVYLEYAKAARPVIIVLWALAVLAEMTMSLLTGLWIKHWSELNDSIGGNYQPGKYLGIYSAIGLGVCIFGCAESLIGRVVCGISASKTLHDRMAQAIFRAPMSFFETTPAGQITNRFSTDINAIDDGLIESFGSVLSNVAYIAFTLGVILWTTPFFAILILPMAYVCRQLQQYYIRTTRELARMDSATKSPIFSHFQESLGGMASIRAYKREEAFARENINRIEANLRAFMCFTTTNRWVMIRLELIAAIVVGGTSLLVVSAIGVGYVASAGAVGLALSYTLQVAQDLSFLVRMSVEIEAAMVSVERVTEYSKIEPEAKEVLTERRPPQDWPQSGAVEFKDYNVRYREGLPLTLKNINLDIKAGERVGIVGRTGAGKSTLTLALFRLIEPASGHVAIDEINTSNLGLWDVRSNLSIIPQDAAIIAGTMRNNLDPAGKHSDEKLWHALEHAQLKDHVNTMEDKLDAKLDEGGSNLSQGQRQLVSLARALLTDSKILVLDEATSAVDHVTDKLLQETLRSDLFAKRTIITIAHRINTIVDSDRVVVLDKGEVKEFDTPAALVNKGGLFRDLVQEAGLLGMFESN